MNGYINNKVNYYLYLHAQQQYQISRFSAQICLQFYFLPGLLKTSLSFLESGKKKIQVSSKQMVGPAGCCDCAHHREANTG